MIQSPNISCQTQSLQHFRNYCMNDFLLLICNLRNCQEAGKAPMDARGEEISAFVDFFQKERRIASGSFAWVIFSVRESSRNSWSVLRRQYSRHSCLRFSKTTGSRYSPSGRGTPLNYSVDRKSDCVIGKGQCRD
jgi:hypothetical protein